MTPLAFEALYQAEWTELEAQLDAIAKRRSRASEPGLSRGSEPGLLRETRPTVSGARTAALYRRACEHLALARARAYPAYIVDRLERITSEGHQLIYQQRDFGLGRLRALIAHDFPAAVRAHRVYVLVSALVFLLPTFLLGVLVYRHPELILSIVSPEQAAQFEDMYSANAESIGRIRAASTDLMMFGFYIRNNIGVAFQCYAAGVFAGLGSLFFLAFNGAFGGAIGGYLTGRGLASTFYPFVATHSAFELTAIVISGAAGLRLGHAWLTDRRLTRLQALVVAARESVVLVYGCIGMLVIAAAIEAFWSSASWLNPRIKFAVAAMCWTAVFAYFALQGRASRGGGGGSACPRQGKDPPLRPAPTSRGRTVAPHSVGAGLQARPARDRHAD